MFLEQDFFAKHIDKNRRDLLLLDGLLDSGYLILNDIQGLLGLSFSLWNGMCPTKSTHNCELVFIFFLGQLNSFKHFNLILSIESISWLDFYRSGPEFAHSGQILIKMSGKFLDIRLSNRLGGESNTQPFIVYVNIPLTVELHLILSRPVPHEHRMCMRVNKTRQNAVFRAVDYWIKNGIVGVETLNLLYSSDLFYNASCIYHNWYIISGLDLISVFESYVRFFAVWYLQKLLYVVQQ